MDRFLLKNMFLSLLIIALLAVPAFAAGGVRDRTDQD